MTAPLLGTLDRFLVLFELDLLALQVKLTAMQWIDWPPSDAGSEQAVFRSAEEFAQASAVIRGFE